MNTPAPSTPSAEAVQLAAHRKSLWLIADVASKLLALDLPPLCKAQAHAIMRLAGNSLTNIVGEADGTDARRLSEDLVGIGQAIDPLIAAIGEHAADNFHGIDKRDFADVLANALGDAIGALDRAAERRDEEIREFNADPIGWMKTQTVGVD